MAVVRRVGMPENDSERKAIAFLAERLPGDDFVLFHNLELANQAGFPYEYDMVLVGEYAVYAIETKHNGGTIGGNETEWELESGRIVPSPMPLANKKAKVLADRLRRFSPVVGQAFVTALVVLTREPVRLRLRDEQQTRILPLSGVPAYVLDPARLPVRAERITHLTDRICEAIQRQFTPLHRQRTIGEYEVIEPLGEGEGYRTLLARHTLLRAAPPVLLKVHTLNIYDSAEKRSRMRDLLTRDAEVLYRLGAHPNIVRVAGFFPWEDDKFVLAMEWTDGRSLRSRLKDADPLATAAALALARGILAGLAHAHAHGVVHRNLRPEAVFVGDDGAVKLAHFDAARVEDDALRTIATRVVGRLDPRYVAPEVLANPSAASPRSDLFAVGRILREALTGQPSGYVTGDVGEVIARLDAPDPAKRYSDAAAAAEDVAILT